MYDIEKLRQCFPETTVYKDRVVARLFKNAKIESFLRDWIIRRIADSDGRVADIDRLSDYIAKIIPKRTDRGIIEDEARTNGETRPFLTKIAVSYNSKANYMSFEIANLGFTFDKTIIEDYVWERIKKPLLERSGGWGLVKIGYLPPDGNKNNGKFTLLDYKNFRPYNVNLDAYREARAKYNNVEEWMDVLLGAIDYDPDGFKKPGMLEQDVWKAKHTMLTRLIPFVQPRMNLIELAPQQTGKSYIFGNIGKYGWLAGGGSMSRAKLFADMRPGAKTKGLVTFTDFVAIDEIKSINFTNDKEMAGIFKGYMENGWVHVGGERVEGDAGIIFLGNIDVNDMSGGHDMFKELPGIFRDSALLQRIHGFIPGRCIPSISPSMIINGWALNTEYFAEIMHCFHDKKEETMRYRAMAEKLVSITSRGKDNSNREQDAVLNLCAAYLKLFFPHVNDDIIDDISFKNEFNRYCLQPAKMMQETVLEQMKIINPNEFANKSMATYQVR